MNVTLTTEALVSPMTCSTELMADLYKAKLLAHLVPIGSFHAFGEGADEDYVVELSPITDVEDAVAELEGVGYTVTSPTEYGENPRFVAMRKGRLNLLVTGDAEFAELSAAAFDVVRVLNLRDKAQRIAVHRIIVDGKRL